MTAKPIIAIVAATDCFAHLKHEHLNKAAEQNEPNANAAKPKEVRVTQHDGPTDGLSKKYPNDLGQVTAN